MIFFPTIILFHLLTRKGQLSVSVERMCTVVNSYVAACPGKMWIGELHIVGPA